MAYKLTEIFEIPFENVIAAIVSAIASNGKIIVTKVPILKFRIVGP